VLHGDVLDSSSPPAGCVFQKRTRDYLAGAKAWIDKGADSALDTKPLSQALEAAENAVRDVEELREKLAAADNEQRVTFLVLQETLKSAKHARKAHHARDKAAEDSSTIKAKSKKARSTRQ